MNGVLRGQTHTGLGNHRPPKASGETSPAVPQSWTSGFWNKQTLEKSVLVVQTLQAVELCYGSLGALVHRCSGSSEAFKKSSEGSFCLFFSHPCNSWTVLVEGFHTDLKKQLVPASDLICRSNPNRIGHKTHLYPRENLFHQDEVAAPSRLFAYNIGGRNTTQHTWLRELLVRGLTLCLELSGSVYVAGKILALT